MKIYFLDLTAVLLQNHIQVSKSTVLSHSRKFSTFFINRSRPNVPHYAILVISLSRPCSSESCSSKIN